MKNKTSRKFRQWRIEHSLVQKQAAEILGINPRTYQEWEQGRGGPNTIEFAELERRMKEYAVTL